MTRDEFIEKFEVNEDNGSFLYKTTACFNRHKAPRDSMMDNRVSKYGGFEQWEETQIQNSLAEYLAQGYKLKSNETLDEFINRCTMKEINHDNSQ